MLNADLQQKYERLKSAIAAHGRVIVAFSGGVDSSLVAYVAGQTLGSDALAVTSGSKSLKRSDLALTTELAEKWGMSHRIIVTDELSKPDYRANPVDRCFHCKTSLYEALDEISRALDGAKVLNGTNCDDLGDHRPGLVAADEHDVGSPLVEAGFSKADIRALADHLGLDNAAKPQAACLSSRFPYGSHINEERLEQVERAENVLAELGFSQFRVRHHEEVARLELVREEMARALDLAEEIEQRIRQCGFKFVTLNLTGFKSGSLNEGVIKLKRVGN
jgi:uncharacterized protein